MPDFAIVDAHVHVWEPEQFPMSWLAGNALLNRPYSLEDYQQQTQGLAIAAMVYVEVAVDPGQELREAQRLVELARTHPHLQAIVAAAALEQGAAIRTHLEALRALSPLIKGVRRNTQQEEPGFCIQPAFVQGVQLLAEYRLSCDICIYHHQLPEIIELVRQCPNTAFVLDHAGKPNIREHQLDPWREQLQELATLPNIMCKVSGMVTEADHEKWQPADLAPYIYTVIDAFGENRVLFGGDWPVILLASNYRRWYETLDSLTMHLTPAARKKLWAENARLFYRLDLA